MNIVIQKLGKTDLVLAQKLLLSWSEGDTPSPIPSNGYLNKQLGEPAFHIYVALDGEKVVGGLHAYELDLFTRSEKEIFLYEIGVSASYRQQGIARRLTEDLIEYARKNKVNCIYVATEPDNHPAKKLYDSTGGKYEEIAWFTYDL